MMHDTPGGLLRTIVMVLEAARIPRMVVGSFASTAHGEPRTTRDLDLVIDPSLDQLNEVLINAVIHRDFSRASSCVAIAVFDDCIEVRSVGDFPTGIRAELLLKEHPSILRNPLIAGAFHWTGAVEVWGRGTNRVIEACRAHVSPRPSSPTRRASSP
jgi:hypothetical protein